MLQDQNLGAENIEAGSDYIDCETCFDLLTLI